MESTQAEPTPAAAPRDFTLQQDNGLDVEFHGVQLSSVSSRQQFPRGSRHAISPQRWTEIGVYRSRAGKWLAHVVGQSTYEGERARHALHVTDSPASLVVWLAAHNGGHLGTLAKDALQAAGIKCVMAID